MRHQCPFEAWFKKNGAKLVIETGSFDVSRKYGGTLTVVARVEIGEPVEWDQKFEFSLPTDATIAQCVAACMIEAAELGAGSFSEFCDQECRDERDGANHARWSWLANINDHLNAGFGEEALYRLEQLYYHGVIDADDKEKP